jgi:predicted alpha/beta-fold hydrolase
MLKWLGESSDRVHRAVRAAAAISVPFDLSVASDGTERGFARLYGWFFLRSLKEKTRAKLRRFPGMVDHRALGRARTLREFDDIVTAPVHGFADATEYYARSSSIRFLETVGVPTLLLCAANDPFVNADVLRQVRNIADRNSFLECVFPERGGHVGFVSGVVPWRARYWMEDYTLDWLAARSGPK